MGTVTIVIIFIWFFWANFSKEDLRLDKGHRLRREKLQEAQKVAFQRQQIENEEEKERLIELEISRLRKEIEEEKRKLYEAQR